MISRGPRLTNISRGGLVRRHNVDWRQWHTPLIFIAVRCP